MHSILSGQHGLNSGRVMAVQSSEIRHYTSVCYLVKIDISITRKQSYGRKGYDICKKFHDKLSASFGETVHSILIVYEME